MNKAEFIEAIALKTGLSKKDSKSVVDATLETITETLVAGESVSFIGFGTFSTSNRGERMAKIPGTDKTVNVPAKRVAKFKAGKGLREEIIK